MKIKYTLLILVFSIPFIACESTKKSEETEEKKIEKVEMTKADSLVKSIGLAHKKSLFNSKEVIQFDLNLTFGGKPRFEGKISMTPDGSRIKMVDSSVTMIWDGKKAFIMPDTANDKGARFALLTWSYFFAAPYKLSDDGTKHEFLGNQPLAGSSYPSTKLTFEEGVGDSPDDWYVVYKDTDSDLLAALAYIVTFGGTEKTEAEKDPHAITYEAYVEVEGIPFATQWNFWSWNTKGELNKLLGSAVISNIKFIKKADVSFKHSANYKEIMKPEA